MSNYENKGGRPAKQGESPFTGIFRSLIKDATQQEVANKIGVSRQNIGKWLSGSTTPDIDTLCKIADAYNVSTDYLLGRTEIKSADPEISAICKLTGLSDEAVSILKEGYPEYTRTINALFDDVSIQDFDVLGYGSMRSVPSVIKALFRYLCVSSASDSSSWYISKNGDLIDTRSTNKEYIDTAIGSFAAATKLKDITISEVVEKILFDDVCAAIKRLKEHSEPGEFEPTEKTGEIFQDTKDDDPF